MDFIPSHYPFGMCSSSINFPEVFSSTVTPNDIMSDVILSSTSTTAEEKALAACKSHSEAERRRRRRINGHLATLRTLLPNTIKTDKASLLAEVVRRVKELKKTTSELAVTSDSDACNTYSSASANINIANEHYMFPSETDELKLCYCGGDSSTIKASLCCEDRPELISELTRALRSVEAKVVKAEMATVGGRTKSELWVRVSLAGDGGLVLVRQALKVVVDRVAFAPASGQALLGNKRPRTDFRV
ncbi:hypothetical protein RJ640_013055 [Escallonia rubra]|uniref:BHLH domain-containing protein n=1 Tax=Escallonia rubra TaxID=112253 RepID=A0AA88RNN3_9ASTE|nr:hypothetical protein RJ640_013055 [Escallonia rubra]